MIKKNLLFTLALLMGMVASEASAQETDNYSGDVAINEENFPDENFRNWVLAQSYGQDDVLTEEEIGRITSIDVKEKGISSLEGIKFFTALQRLDCYDNQLTELDVSANTALRELRCWDNQLTSLNVSGCVALRGLYCDNNQLTALDVSANTELSTLNCYRNQIRGEAMGNLIANLNTCSEAQSGIFYVYYAESNEANVCTKAQVAQAKAKNWNVRYAYPRNPQYPSQGYEHADYEGYDPDEGEIVISETFPDANFRARLLEQDYGRDGILTIDEIAGITTIDVTNFNLKRPISSLEGINVFTALEVLYCHGHQLTTLDVSANTALQLLDCSSNQLTTLDLSANTSLHWLSCYSNQISGEAMDNLIASLNDRSETEDGYLNVCYHQSLYEANVCTMAQVAQAKAKNWRAKFVFYDPVSHMEFFADYEGSDAEKKDIAIDETNFPDENFRNYLLEQDYGQDGILTHDEIYSITEINVNEKGIRSLEGINVFKVLLWLHCDDNQLTSLDVSANTILHALYCNNNQLTTLNVSGCEALQYLCCYNNQLTSLDVSKSTYLSELHCYQNQIKGAAMNALVESLPTRSRGRIYIYINEDGNVMTTTQVAAAKAKGWTPYFYILGNWREYAGSKPVDVAIDETNFPDENFRNYLLEQDYGQDGILTEEEIYRITEINVSERGVSSLEGINVFTALQTLSCFNNQLTTLDLSGCTALRYLNCYNNQIHGEAMDALISSLPTVDDGSFIVIDTSLGADEGNSCTKEQIAAAQKKGWNVLTNNIPLEPIGAGEEINIGDEINSDTSLDGNVVGNILYNISTGNGEFSSEEGCIIINKSTSDDTMSNLEGKDIFGEDFKDQYTGIVFKVSEGSGKVKVEAETTGDMVLKVKIGNSEPIEMELDGKLKISVPYNVSEETMVYIYGSTKAAQVKRAGMGVTNTVSGSLKIYGIEIAKDATGIRETIIENQPQDVYSLSGQKVRSQAKDLKGLPTGIYIVNGKKVIMK